MANISTDIRREQVLHYLQKHADEWVDGPSLATPQVGGSEGLRRVRELRAAGHRIKTRPHPDRARDIFQYKLIPPESINPVLQERLDTLRIEYEVAASHKEDEVTVIDEVKVTGAVLTPGMAGREFPMRMTEEGTYELTKEVCVDCGGMYDDDLEHRTTDARHLRWEEKHRNQLTIGLPEQPPPYKFTKMPEILDMSKMAICPRCKGRRRPAREWFSRKLGKIVVETAEDFTRDPFKPTIKGEPNVCARCGGFGLIPQYVREEEPIEDAPLLFQLPD